MDSARIQLFDRLFVCFWSARSYHLYSKVQNLILDRSSSPKAYGHGYNWFGSFGIRRGQLGVHINFWPFFSASVLAKNYDAKQMIWLLMPSLA